MRHLALLYVHISGERLAFTRLLFIEDSKTDDGWTLPQYEW